MGKYCLTINPSKSQAIVITPLLSQVVLPANINIKFSFCSIAISDCITYLSILRKLQNKAMQVINNMQRSSNADPLFSKNKILKLKDLVRLETSK